MLVVMVGIAAVFLGLLVGLVVTRRARERRGKSAQPTTRADVLPTGRPVESIPPLSIGSVLAGRSLTASDVAWGVCAGLWLFVATAAVAGGAVTVLLLAVWRSGVH